LDRKKLDEIWLNGEESRMLKLLLLNKIILNLKKYLFFIQNSRKRKRGRPILKAKALKSRSSQSDSETYSTN